jgi:hypothetical protein
LRVVHLSGGLYAINPPQDDEVHLYASSPADADNVLYSFKIPAYPSLFTGLRQLGLEPLGVVLLDDARQQEGIRQPHTRHHFRSSHNNPWVAWDALQTWKQIAFHAATDDTDIPLMDLARRISFELRACSDKWFDLSHAYGAVLSGQVKSGSFKAGRGFVDANSFSVYLAVHSLLSEMSSLRDYLAEFVAQHVLVTEMPNNPHTKMSTLRRELKKQTDVGHPAARRLLEITSEDNNGWMVALSAYRDLVIHHAPVNMTEGLSFLVGKEIELKGGFRLPYIQSYLPPDPMRAKRERSRGASIRTLAEWNRVFTGDGSARGPDALLYLHRAVGELALLALEMAGYSPVKPGPTTLMSISGTLEIVRG